MGRINRRILAIVAAVLAVLVLGGGIAFAMASNNSGSPASAPTACATATTSAHGTGKGAGAGDRATKDLVKLVGSGISGTLVVADSTAPGGYVTVIFARGQLASINTASGQITVQLPNNTTQTFTLGTGAKIQIGKKAGTIASLQDGMNVLVISRQAQGQPATVSVLVQKAPGSANNAGATPTATSNS